MWATLPSQRRAVTWKSQLRNLQTIAETEYYACKESSPLFFPPNVIYISGIAALNALHIPSLTHHISPP